jgi:signal transduction histidine kinase
LNAYEWYKKYTYKKESIFNAEKSKQIAEMQSAFDLERKDQEIASLNTEKELQESLSKNQQITFAVIIVFLIVASMGLLYILRQRQKASEVLERQKQYAEELNQLNDKLFSIISHDLRAPLWSLKGVLEMASTQMISEKELTSLLSSIGDNTQHVIDLLENLLNWSKGHLRGNTINTRNIELCRIVLNVIELNNPIAAKKQIQINHAIDKRINVFADKNMIELVVRNILSNAIKFTPQSGSVNISCTTNSTHATLSIQDSGVGIKKEVIGKLFGNENFSTQGTANEKGTGLGLILCKEFVEKNGGTIMVESAEGKGSTFMITIPVSKSAQNPVVQSNGSTLTQSTSA